jgi:hypothetical protein
LIYNNFGTVLQIMAKVVHQKTKMKNKEEENSGAATAAEEISSELAEPVWSVITFDETAASGLTFDEAFALRTKLEAEKVSGLCIVTDETAARMNADKK